MDRNFFLIVMAAGHGTRMGADIPKQFLSLAGVPILQRTIQKFIDAVPGLQVITVLPPDEVHVNWWKTHCIEKNFSCPQMLVKGGITRFHSVRSALERVPDGALVAIQDGVRPLLSTGLIKSMLDSFSTTPGLRALIPVIPTVDTLKMLRREDGVLVQSPGPEPDRSALFGAQTPQFFLSEDIKAAYRQPYDVSFTDDASVASRYEIPLAFCEGERLNFKITSPDDLLLAEAVLKVRGQV